MGVKIDSLKQQKHVIDFFEQLMEESANAPNVLALSNSGLRKVDTGYVFDLPSLHKAIFPLKDISYKTFKEVLYAGYLNKILLEKGLFIEVYDQVKNNKRGKLDSNLYYLKALV